MTAPWKECACDACKGRNGGDPQHALWDVNDVDTGDKLSVRVPWSARADHLGWGERPHVRWDGDDGESYGLEVGRGARGLTVMDRQGRHHQLEHGRYREHRRPLAPPPTAAQRAIGVLQKALPWRLFALAKADGGAPAFKVAKALKPGQRWITVHPNGPDEKGVPVLIQQESDGSHRIIGGAGGKLTHLRLHNVGSEEEHAAKAAATAKDRRAAEKERKAAQPKDDAKAEKQAKADVEAAKKLAERDFIEKVRAKIGGISEDIDPDRIKGLSSGARSLVESRHHMKQLREAEKLVAERAKKLVGEHVNQAIESEQVRRSVEEDPVISEQASELAASELELQRKEDEERRAERRARTLRTTSGDAAVGARAAEAAKEVIASAPAPDAVLARHGGRDDDPKGAPLRQELLPSEEVERRAAQSMQDAKILLDVAEGKEVKGDVAERVVAKLVARAEVDPTDHEALKQAALNEAARQARRAEMQKARSDRLKQMEGSKDEGGEAGAERSLAFADMLGGFVSSAATAKKMGLTDTERTPLQEPEIAEIMDVLKSKATLREKRNEFAAINKEAENGKYDRSRRAFELQVKPSDEKIQTSVQEDIQRELTERMLGMISPRRSEHLQALAVGHYDALADVGLGIAGQRFVDRPTVDAIGVGNAALLMRHAMETHGHDTSAVLSALQDHHVEQLVRQSAAAIDQADKYVPGLSTTVEDVGDIEKALAHLDAHEADVGDAQRALGSALGRLEATATLGQAFRQKLPDQMTLETKSGEVGTSLAWLHSIGLRPQDYRIDAKEGKIHIPRSSWDRMISPVPKEELERRNKANEIKAGKHDEIGYLPPGIVTRAATSFTAPTPDAPRYHEPLQFSGDMRAHLEDHVGSRLADGEQPHEILHDLLAPVNVNAAPDSAAYTDHVRTLFPLVGPDGKPTKYEEHRGHFERLAEQYMVRKYGAATGAMHAQDIGVDKPETHDAVFRTLAKHPEAVAAFVPTGQLSSVHQRALRDHFYKRQGIDPKARGDDATFQRELGELGPEPSETAGTMSMFGFGGPTPEYQEWAAKRDAVLARHPRVGLQEALKAAKGDPVKEEAARRAAAEATTPWERFVETHGSLELAQRALQDEMKGAFIKDFQKEHGRLTGASLKTGVTGVTNQERHIKAVASDEEAAALRARAQSAYAKLRDRAGGKFASEGEGAVKQKFTEHLEQETIDRQNQGFLFGSQQLAPEPTAAPAPKEPGAGERVTLGARAEAQLASLVPHLGAQFEPGKPVGLFGGLNMDGPRVHQQRVIKMLEANGNRLGAWLGTGSGKSLTSIGAFTSAHAKGKAKHGLYLVPSAVQEQFGGEMLRYTEPGKYRWATGAGKGHDERVAMLKDPSLHMRVMTHQSFRDTALRIMAEHHGRSIEQMKQDLGGASPKTRATWMREAFDAQGIPRHFTYLDEAHMASAREGEDPSGINLVMSAATHPDNADGALIGTATPHKNDESEVHSMASMLDPDRYGDRHMWMQGFGKDLAFNPDAVRRELSHITYSAKVDPEGVDRTDTDNPRIEGGGGGMFGGGGPARKVGGSGPLPLTGEHKALVDGVSEAFDAARKARERGEVDVKAMRTLSPARFEGAPAEEHERIARELLPSLGVLKESAMRRAVNGAPPDVNIKVKALTDVVKHDLDHGEWTDRAGATHKGKPSIIFTDRLSEAEMLHKHLSSQGIRTALYHGGLTSQERESIRSGYQPEGGAAPKHDVLIATSAAEAGINLQRAKVLHHYDVPMTEKSHAQRSGRAYRQGQQGDVDVHNWHTDAEFEQNALRRLKRKGGLASVFQTPLGSLDEHGVSLHYRRALARKHETREVAPLPTLSGRA